MSPFDCPKVGILIPILNESDNLEILLDRILAQTYPHFRVFILDNASTDLSREIIESYSKIDSRIVALFSDIRREAFANWLHLADRVFEDKTFEYVCWHAGDDTWSDDSYLESLVLKLESNPNIDCINPIYEIQDSSGNLIKEIFIEPSSSIAFFRIIALCKNWDYVHHIYGLYTRDAFQYLLESKISRFTVYSGSDWWWTYEFLSRFRSTSTDNCRYSKLLDSDFRTVFESTKALRLQNYCHAISNVCKPTFIHLLRTKEARGKFHLIVIPIVYFTSIMASKLIRMHIKLIERRCLGIWRKLF